MLVQCEAMITQLVFDHSLRIRMKAESSESPAASRATTAAPTPDNASIVEPEPDGSAVHEERNGSSNSSEDETVRASTISGSSTAVNKKGKDVPKLAVPKTVTAQPTTGSGNLVGKINNLVTTDLNNLVEGRDFLFLSAYHMSHYMARRY